MPFKTSKFPLLPRKKDTDKSAYGHVLVLAGSGRMSGAARLVGRACLSAGAGLVTVGVPESVSGIFSKKALAELMCLPLPETHAGTLATAGYSKIMSFIRARRVNGVAIGPGLSHETTTSTLIRKLVKNIPLPVVLDADGLNAYKEKSAELKKHRGALIVTPHRAEFERLFSQKWPTNPARRAALAKNLSRFYDVTIVLKGHHTLVVQKNEIYKNRTGNPGMAKGGSGDVLTGVIAAFIAQGLSPFQAASWAVYFHGKAADLAVKTKSELSLLASDIIDNLSNAFRQKK